MVDSNFSIHCHVWAVLFVSTNTYGDILPSRFSLFPVYVRRTKIPASMHEQLKDIMPQKDFEEKYQLMFSFAHIPGVFLPLFAGMVVDRLGGRICLLVLAAICLAGQIITCLGVAAESWPVSLTGRFVYGLAFEPLFITNQSFLVMWFSERDIGLALGVSAAASYLGFLLSFIVSPIAANRVSCKFAFWIGTMIMAISVGEQCMSCRMLHHTYGASS